MFKSLFQFTTVTIDSAMKYTSSK